MTAGNPGINSLFNPYVCGYEECPNFCIATERGMDEEDAAHICSGAMRRIIGSDTDRAVRAAAVGVECGLYLQYEEQNGL